MMNTDVLVIGGSDAGISAALRAREVDLAAKVTVVVADRYPNYSICGLPYFVSGEVGDWHNLAHRTAEDIAERGIDLLLAHTAQAVDATARRVSVIDRAGETHWIAYDKLVIAIGAEPALPNIAGLNRDGVYPLRTMEDGLSIHRHLLDRNPQSAVVIGAGYIGMEMAEALTHRGLDVTVVEYLPQVMPTLDPSLGWLVEAELARQGVRVMTGTAVTAIERLGQQLVVRGDDGFRTSTDLVVTATGVRPSTALAESAGVDKGVRGALCVTRAMETNVADVYAAGDCVETWHRLLDRATYLPLGTTAHKQGRVAGENAVGGRAEYAGSLGTQAVKVFDLVAARTGLRDDEASKELALDSLTVELETWDHKVYYPGAHALHIRITGDRETERLLGAQIVGHRHAEVAKRIDIFAAALFHEMTIDALNGIDLSYTPPLSSPWDPVQMSAQAWMRARWERSA
ncbi:MAG: FAD-dependent oxidoreductase [Anaerolineae bacterium]|jgi:NADPH-dependent 2,4-dienoyl-CoA reductase/sulfur reductase-like enzyme